MVKAPPHQVRGLGVGKKGGGEVPSANYANQRIAVLDPAALAIWSEPDRQFSV